jgi:hypothetical protein
MSVRRISAAGLAALHRAVNDPATVERFRSKVAQVPGSQCLWWTGAISGRGHGRFWLGPTVLANQGVSPGLKNGQTTGSRR